MAGTVLATPTTMNRSLRTSPLRTLGVKNNDVLTHVNGTSIADPAALAPLLGTLSDESEFTLKILRGGKPMNLEYRVQ
jgi:S1-C subfamily serine protease